jgi:hypothetical protein
VHEDAVGLSKGLLSSCDSYRNVNWVSQEQYALPFWSEHEEPKVFVVDAPMKPWLNLVSHIYLVPIATKESVLSS